MARLLVDILEGRNLIACNNNGTSDPYIIANLLDFAERTVPNENFRTDVKSKTLNPVWRASTQFGQNYNVNNKDAPATLEIKMFDKQMLADDPMGMVKIPVDSINGVVDQWYPLQKFGRMKTVSGDVHLRIELRVPAGAASSASPTRGSVTAGNVAGAAGIEEGKSSGLAVDVLEEDAPEYEDKDPTELIIIAVQARGIQIMDRNLIGSGGTSDPLIKFSIGGADYKTTVKPKTLAPVWRERFNCPVFDESDSLEIVCEDHDLTVNDFMGKVVVPMNNLANKATVRRWYKLGNRQGVVDEVDRGEVEIVLKWHFNAFVSKPTKGVLGNLLNKVTGDASTEPDDNPDADMFEKEKPAEEAEKEAKDKAEAEKALKDALGNIEVKSGDYQVQVHIIECRDLKAEDETGLSDPVCYIECFGQKQNTAVIPECLSCVFDELFIFNMRNLDKQEFEDGIIRISVMDADTFSKNDMIGSFVIDATSVYFQKDHEYYRKWVALMDDEDPDDSGVQGYLKLSIQITGPGDKLKIHNDEEEMAKEKANESGGMSSMCIMPPTIKKEKQYIVTSVYRSEYLPQLDSSAIGSGGVDAYYQVEFAGGKQCRTKVKTVKGDRTQLNPKFNYELWYPITVPTMTSTVKHSVWDHDTVGSDEIISTHYTKLSVLQKLAGNKRDPFWINLYGASTYDNPNPLNALKKAVPGEKIDYKEQYNTIPDKATTFRGRVLIAERIEKTLPESCKDNDNAPFRRKIRKLSAKAEPPKRDYVLKALLVSGTELPAPRIGNKLQVKIACGMTELFSQRMEVRKGVCEWYELIETREPMSYPAALDQVPDIFVYLCKGTDKDLVPFCYARFKAEEMMKKGFRRSAEWILLQEDKGIDALEDGQFPGTLLLRLGFGLAADAEIAMPEWRASIQRMRMRIPYQLRVHIYQGRGLPAADDDGLLDPYLVINILGQEKKLEKKRSTTDPLWYESYKFDVELPDMEFAPQVCVQLFDWDLVGSDDYIGTFFFNVRDSFVLIKDTDAFPDPSWHTVFREVPGDCEGDVLMSFQLLPKRTPDQVMPPMPSILPSYRDAFLEIIVLGMRDMVPFQFMGMTLPYLELELDHGGGKELVTTDTSKKPEPSNPNYLQRLILPVKLPTNALFASPLKIRARDTRLGGYVKPVVGNGVIDLVTKIPWSSTYVPPQMDMVSEIPESAGVATGPGDDAAANAGIEEKKDSGSSAAGAGIEMKTNTSTAGTKILKDPATARKLNEEAKKRENLTADPNIATPAPYDLESLVQSRVGKTDQGAGVFGAMMHVDVPEDVLARRKKKGKTADDYFINAADLEAEDEDEGPPKYMKNRKTIPNELEEELKTSPFESYELHLGSKFGGLFGPDYRTVGKFKGLIRVMMNETDPPLFNLGELLKPQGYKIRLYVLRGIGLTPMDMGFGGRPGKSDPYLLVKLGKETFDDREHKIDDVTDVDLYKLVEVSTELPGAGQLQINVMDYDDIGSDDLIGKTVIDLEDRWFDKRWQELGKENRVVDDINNIRWDTKPLERRSLYIPTNTRPQGSLECWVDIMSPAEANTFPPDDVSLPPRAKFEVRLVIWKTKDVVAMDTLENMNDLFVTAWVEDTERQDTDTHWRCKKGKGSFNWRMKFQIELGHNTRTMKFPYLHLQMWDKDILKWNDCIAESVVDLGKYFKKAYKKNVAIKLFDAKSMKKKKKDGDAASDKNIVRFDPEEVPPADDAVAANGATTTGKADGKTAVAGGAATTTKQPATGETKSSQPKPAAVAEKPKSSSWCPGGKTPEEEEEEEALLAEDEKKATAQEGDEDTVAMVNQFKEMTGLWDIDPPDSTWLKMERTNFETGTRDPMGQLCYSLQIWPEEKSLAMPVGAARNDPNNDPYLPPPTGRLKFSWNPFAMALELCGPSLCIKFFCCLIYIAFVLLAIFCQPALNAMIFLLSR